MANALQDHFAGVLLDHIRNDTYPSSTYMDMLEAVATPKMRLEYVLHLMDRIQEEPYPSIPMMRRVQSLIAEFG